MISFKPQDHIKKAPSFHDPYMDEETDIQRA